MVSVLMACSSAFTHPPPPEVARRGEYIDGEILSEKKGEGMLSFRRDISISSCVVAYRRRGRRLPYITHENTYLSMYSHGNFLDNREGANTGRWFLGEVSTGSSQRRHFVVCAPPISEKLVWEIRARRCCLSCFHGIRYLVGPIVRFSCIRPGEWGQGTVSPVVFGIFILAQYLNCVLYSLVVQYFRDHFTIVT